jgi:hypothetical protein
LDGQKEGEGLILLMMKAENGELYQRACQELFKRNSVWSHSNHKCASLAGALVV